jgi:hypothetical protein
MNKKQLCRRERCRHWVQGAMADYKDSDSIGKS